MAAFVPCGGLPALRGAGASATTRSASRLRMTTPAPVGGAKPVSRRQALQLLAAAAAAGGLLAPPAQAADEGMTTTASGLKYKVVKKGTGPTPVTGDLVTIRFKGEYNGVVFDDLFKVEEPYFYRMGSENILKGGRVRVQCAPAPHHGACCLLPLFDEQGVAEGVQLMSVGDVYELSIPPALAFGTKGRRASAGKPSIPAGAYVTYTVEMTELPGKQLELLEVTGGTIDDDDAA